MSMEADGESPLAVTVEWNVTKVETGKQLPVTRYAIAEPTSMTSVVQACQEAKENVNEILTHVVEKGSWPPSIPQRIAPECAHGFPYTALECQYSPSHWTGSEMSPDQVIAQYVKKMLTYPPADLFASMGGQVDLAYGEGDNEKVDIYGSDVLPATAPVFAFVHGGYWQMGSRKEATVMVSNLFRQGVISAIIGYDLAPGISLEKMIQQIVKATGFMNDWCTRRGSRALYLCGHSAGAHLVAQAVMTDSKDLELVKGIFLVSGVYDLLPLVGTYVDRPLGLTPETAKRLSPIHQIAILPEASRRVLSEINIRVVVGAQEPHAFLEQSKQFFDQLCTLKLLIDPGHHVIEEVDHFEVIECLDDPASTFCKLICLWMGLAVG